MKSWMGEEDPCGLVTHKSTSRKKGHIGAYTITERGKNQGGEKARPGRKEKDVVLTEAALPSRREGKKNGS